MSGPSVVVLDYGFGNVRSAVRALERVGADVELTNDRAAAESADGLVVPGVGAFAAVMEGLRAVRGDQIVGRRLAGDVDGLAVDDALSEGVDVGAADGGLVALLPGKLLEERDGGAASAHALEVVG